MNVTLIANRIPAARRRAADARAKADRRPTEDNLNRAAELEGGLARMEQEAAESKGWVRS